MHKQIQNVLNKKLIVHIVFNKFSPDQRILKEVKTISEKYKNKEIIVVALKSEGFANYEKIKHNIHIIRIDYYFRFKIKNSIIAFVQYYLIFTKVVNLFKDKSVDIIHCHDLNTLHLGLKLKKMLSTKLIFDSHELYTHKSFSKLKFISSIIGIYEKLVIHKINGFITVSDSILKWYQNL